MSRKLTANDVGFQGTDTVKEKDPVQVVNFVLQGDRFKTLCFDPDRLAFEVKGFDQNSAVPGDEADKIRDTEAAFPPGLLAS